MSEATVRGIRKERVGVVVSDVQDKTIVVNVERRTAHPLYRKVVKVSNMFFELGICRYLLLAPL